MNIVILAGRLTRDPEQRYTQSGTGMTSFGLAVTERYKDGKGEWVERANFFDVTIWGKRGEAFARYHKKGAPALIHGKLRFESWEDKQTGAKRSKVTVVGEEWEFCGAKGGDRGDSGSSAPSSEAAASAGGFDDDTPF